MKTSAEKAAAEKAASAASEGGGGAATSLDEEENPVRVWLRKISLDKYSDKVVDFGYDSMDALLVANEKDVIEMTEDASIAMKNPHKTLFVKAWKEMQEMQEELKKFKKLHLEKEEAERNVVGKDLPTIREAIQKNRVRKCPQVTRMVGNLKSGYQLLLLRKEIDEINGWYYGRKTRQLSHGR